MKKLIYYGLPGLPLAMLGLPLFIYLPNFYNQELGLSLTVVGFVLLIARSLDVVTDPIIGFLNDRYPRFKTLAYRRKSFILIGIPLLLIGLNLLLKPSIDVTATYLFIGSFVTYLGWTLINIPWLALGAEISTDYHIKSDLASSREIFSVVGTIAVISIPVVLSLGSDTKATMDVLATLLTVLIPLALLPLLIKINLNEEATQQLKQQTQAQTKVKINPSSIVKRFSCENLQIIKYPAIRKLLPAYFVNSIANALPATLFILYVTYVLQIPEKVGILLISYFFSAVIGIPFWLYLAKKTDKHISWRFALYGSVASFIWVPFIGQGDFIPFLLICIASGIFLGADVVMPSSIQADIAQKLASEQATEQSQHSQYSAALLFGLWGMLTKLSLALAIGIAFPLLDFASLQLNQTEIHTPTNTGTITLVLLYAMIPILLKVWVIIQLHNFEFGHDYFCSEQPLNTNNINNTIRKRTNENTHSKINRPISITAAVKRL